MDELSARRRDFYLTAHNTHKRQTSKPPVGFEPTISGVERPQTYALDRSAVGTGSNNSLYPLIFNVANAISFLSQRYLTEEEEEEEISETTEAIWTFHTMRHMY